jgi:formate hydrogenlyase subunit 4
MGAAREVTFAWLAEPALFLGFVALARLSGNWSLDGMLGGEAPLLRQGTVGSLVLVVAGWFVVLLAENCRIPFDDPNTHLELTMIHEVMVLDHSGPAFGMILYGASVKLLAFAALVAGVAVPAGSGNAWLDWLVFLATMIGIAVLVGIVESIMARLRLVTVPRLLVAASLLTAFAVVFLIA